MNDDENIKKSIDAIVPGEDISKLSISELEVRITVLREEIERLQGAIKHKCESKNAADSIFKI